MTARPEIHPKPTWRFSAVLAAVTVATGGVIGIGLPARAVTGPSITVAPSPVCLGDPITIAGTGWTQGSSLPHDVFISQPGFGSSLIASQSGGVPFTVAADGSFSVPAPTLASAAAGTYQAYVIVGAGDPTPYGPQISAVQCGSSSALNIRGVVSNYEPWLDPTGQPLVRLTVLVTNAQGAPAAGAKVQFSNANAGAVWTVPANGTIQVVEDVSKGVPDVTVRAALGSVSTSSTIHIFDVSVMTQCHIPGEARQADALSSLLDNVLVAAPSKLLDSVWNFLDLFSKSVSVVPDSVTTVGTALEYTGTFSTIYGLDVHITRNSDGSVVKQYPRPYSRSYNLVRPLFDGDGTPIQRIGRQLVCGAVA